MFNLCVLHIVNNDPPKVFPIASAIAQAPTNESTRDKHRIPCFKVSLSGFFETARRLPAQITSPDRLPADRWC
jgi:hypothetical protein